MTDFPRLIEYAFPLKQASLDSVHEKNVRHGHISTLHIWPARRPLAACRAALIATLLPDPSAQPKPEGMSDAEWQKEIQRRRKELCEKIGGKVVKRVERKKMPGGEVVEREKEETIGGILHWGRETENAETLEWFRQEIRKAYGGRAPKVLDPFAGGGAIPLEAMRLGCEATAVDINPVAWFILKCTLEYPQKLAGRKRPLPAFILQNRQFMESFFKAQGMSKKEVTAVLRRLDPAKEQSGTLFDLFTPQDTEGTEKRSEKSSANSVSSVVDLIQADLAWHVRAWGQWVLDKARRELARFYPVYADFQPLEEGKAYERQPMRLVPLKQDGTPDIDALNAEFSKEYLADKRNPRWIAKPTVAYLWARTVTCKNCRATIPLLKTRWLCKKDRKRVLLTIDVVRPGHASSQNGFSTQPKSIPAKGIPSRDRQGAANLSPDAPLAYFITFTCYGTWLHGDERGSVDRLHNLPGADILPPDPERETHAAAQLRHSPVELDAPRRKVVEQTIREVCAHRGWSLHALNVRTNHIHVVVSAAQPPERVMNDFKSYATRRMVEAGLFPPKTKAWTRHGSTRYLWDEEALHRACQYVVEGQGAMLPGAAERLGPLPDGYSDDVATGPLPDGRGSDGFPRVVFGIENNVPIKGGNAAQRREHDKRIGGGTMSRAGAKCPCCGTIMTMEDLRVEGKAGKMGTVMTAVVVDGPKGKEYRLPTEHELAVARPSEEQVQAAFKDVPFGVPDEPTPAGGGSGAGRAFSVQGYGLMRWRDLFTSRQLMTLGTFVAATRAAREHMVGERYPTDWNEATSCGVVCVVDRLLLYCSAVCRWILNLEALAPTYARFALPMLWDYAEVNALSQTTGSVAGGIDWIGEVFDHLGTASRCAPRPTVAKQSATTLAISGTLDVILTDPPYYDAIPYSDLMDYFYIWLRRSLVGLSPAIDSAFAQELSPKWDHDSDDGELIDDSSRHERDAAKSKQTYEDGMARVFVQCAEALKPEGRFVIVFANKSPHAWETLVSAIVRSGFTVDGSWPLETERVARARAHSSAALASSVWLVCKKRPGTSRAGWDTKVLEEMRTNIAQRLRDFWDAGIRGPDFVWAATGPALEAYSKHPVVKKADDPGRILTVSEFLAHVRRMVIDFIVGRVLSGDSMPSSDRQGAVERGDVDRLDEPTAYYLLHRHDFGLDEAPIGACILYATACGLSDQELVQSWDLLVKTGGSGVPTGEEDNWEDDDGTDSSDTEEEDTGSGGKVKLKPWSQRRGRSMGYEAPGGRPVPLIDRIHRLMHLWKGGDVHKVDEYLDEHGLRRHELFRRVLQSLIELCKPGSEERSLLESLSNHIGAKGARRKEPQPLFTFDEDE